MVGIADTGQGCQLFSRDVTAQRCKEGAHLAGDLIAGEHLARLAGQQGAHAGQGGNGFLRGAAAAHHDKQRRSILAQGGGRVRAEGGLIRRRHQLVVQDKAHSGVVPVFLRQVGVVCARGVLDREGVEHLLIQRLVGFNGSGAADGGSQALFVQGLVEGGIRLDLLRADFLQLLHAVQHDLLRAPVGMVDHRAQRAGQLALGEGIAAVCGEDEALQGVLAEFAGSQFLSQGTIHIKGFHDVGVPVGQDEHPLIGGCVNHAVGAVLIAQQGVQVGV